MLPFVFDPYVFSPPSTRARYSSDIAMFRGIYFSATSTVDNVKDSIYRTVTLKNSVHAGFDSVIRLNTPHSLPGSGADIVFRKDIN